MTTSIKSSVDGTKSYLDLNGATKVTIGASGIEAGSLAPESVTPTELSQKLTLGTAVTLSGTAVDFTGIPGWVKRITLVQVGVSTTGASVHQLQLGTSAAFTTSGYLGSDNTFGLSPSAVMNTTGFQIGSAQAAHAHGLVTLVHIGNNTWVESHSGGTSVSAGISVGGGSVTLSGGLTRVRLTTVNGTDTFDAGTVNIMWE